MVVTATVQGTSMEPTIADGATIGIDRGDTTIKSGKNICLPPKRYVARKNCFTTRRRED